MFRSSEEYAGWEIDFTQCPEGYPEEYLEEDVVIAQVVFDLYAFPREEGITAEKSINNFLKYYYKGRDHHLEIAGVEGSDKTLILKWVLNE